MTKKKEGTKIDKSMDKPIDQLDESPKKMDESPKKMDESVNKSMDKSKDKSVNISIKKYFQLYGSDIHKYTRAYLEIQFRDILKEKEAWKEKINKVMEGGR